MPQRAVGGDLRGVVGGAVHLGGVGVAHGERRLTDGGVVGAADLVAAGVHVRRVGKLPHQRHEDDRDRRHQQAIVSLKGATVTGVAAPSMVASASLAMWQALSISSTPSSRSSSML